MNMIKVIMLQDTQGSLDGMHSTYFKKGEECKLTEYLYNGFVKRGLCKKVGKSVKPNSTNNQNPDLEYENKMLNLKTEIKTLEENLKSTTNHNKKKKLNTQLKDKKEDLKILETNKEV